MPVSDAQAYTLVSEVTNLARSIINDTLAGDTDTPLEGQILTDSSPMMVPFLRSSIRELYRALHMSGVPALIKDNWIIYGLPPLAGPDPTVQTFLGYAGYFDGVGFHSEFLLPSDCIAVDAVWERQSGSGLSFREMAQPQAGLPSTPQGLDFGMWEWRSQQINFLGATSFRDIKLRYRAALPLLTSDSDFDNTSIPIVDCTDAVAYMLASKYADARGAVQADKLEAKAAEEIRKMKNIHTRRQQGVSYHRPEYQGSDQ